MMDKLSTPYMTGLYTGAAGVGAITGAAMMMRRRGTEKLIQNLASKANFADPALDEFGYPCGSSFTSDRNKCYTDPKTGARLKKPITRSIYDKIMKSGGKAAQTLYKDREDRTRAKRREGAKGWRNKQQSAQPKAELETAKPAEVVKLTPVERKRLKKRSDDLSANLLYAQKDLDALLSIPRGSDSYPRQYQVKKQEQFIRDIEADISSVNERLKPARRTRVKAEQSPNKSEKTIAQEVREIAAKSEPKQKIGTSETTKQQLPKRPSIDELRSTARGLSPEDHELFAQDQRFNADADGDKSTVAEWDREILRAKARKRSKPELSLDKVETSLDREKFAAQQLADAKARGDQKDVKSWEDTAKSARKARLDESIAKTKQVQGSLFDTTVMDESPLMKQLREAQEAKPATEKLEDKAAEILATRRSRFEGRRERRLASTTNRAADAKEAYGRVLNESRFKSYDKVRSRINRAEKKAQYYEQKAAGIASNTAISSDDPDAIAKLKRKIAAAERSQEYMKAGNKIVKSKNSPEEKARLLKEAGHSPELLTPRYGSPGYKPFELTNNNANIRRMKERVASLEKQLEQAVKAPKADRELPDLGLKVSRDNVDNRVRLNFDGKPSAEVRTLLKSNGFKWAPSQGAWQRQANTYNDSSVDYLVKRLNDLKEKLGANFGYACGSTFIPDTAKCYTDPKTRARLRVPLTKAQVEKVRSRSAGAEKLYSQQEEAIKNRLRGSGSIPSEYLAAARSVGATKVLPSGIAEVDPKKLNLDPKRFQYKIVSGATGESGSLTDVKKWDSNIAGVQLAWHDPADDKTYVINGHNRTNLAKKLGVESVTTRFIKAKDAKEARAIGAVTNIAENSGNSLDAAKFFRDSGLKQEDLTKKGIPLKSAVASEGIALSKLNDGLFDKVIQGDLSKDRGVIIGKNLSDYKEQSELVDLINKQEKKGKKITNEGISELTDMIANAPKKEAEGGFLGMLGFSPEARSLAVEKAEIQAHIKRQLSTDKKLFGTVGRGKNAAKLERGGNKIDSEQSSAISADADRALKIFDQEKRYSGKTSDAINLAAERIANGEKSARVKEEVYRQVLGLIK